MIACALLLVVVVGISSGCGTQAPKDTTVEPIGVGVEGKGLVEYQGLRLTIPKGYKASVVEEPRKTPKIAIVAENWTTFINPVAIVRLNDPEPDPTGKELPEWVKEGEETVSGHKMYVWKYKAAWTSGLPDIRIFVITGTPFGKIKIVGGWKKSADDTLEGDRVADQVAHSIEVPK